MDVRHSHGRSSSPAPENSFRFSAILARALEIPAVVGVPNLLARVGSGDLIVVDGVHGQIAITPSEALIADTHARAGRFSDVARHRREARDRPIRTKCGVTVELRADYSALVER